MYYEKFVASLKKDGKVLRDNHGLIKIPFDTEYSLYLKNLESRNAVVGITIDGKDVLDGHKLVVPSNESMDLLGFMNGNQVKNKFRFIELTKQLEDRIGYSPEDSLIRIEVWFQKMKPITQEVITTYTNTYPYHWYGEPYRYVVSPYICNGGGRGSSCGTFSLDSFSADMPVAMASCNYSSPEPANDVGITVKGNNCQQDFGSTYVSDLEEQSHVLVLKLSGYQDKQKVHTVVTTKDKIYCPKCGKSNHFGNKFCTDCGKLIAGL